MQPLIFSFLCEISSKYTKYTIIISMVKLQKPFTTLEYNSEILDYSMPVIALFAASQALDMFSLVAIILSEIAQKLCY